MYIAVAIKCTQIDIIAAICLIKKFSDMKMTQKKSNKPNQKREKKRRKIQCTWVQVKETNQQKGSTYSEKVDLKINCERHRNNEGKKRKKMEKRNKVQIYELKIKENVT